MKKFRSLLLIALTFVLLVSCTSTSKNSKDRPLPVDPSIRIGKLDNGMSYYIMQNDYPVNRIVLRLAVNVGSIAEEENERGVAHLIEHMAFNGTEHFEKNSLIDYAESIGMDFGAEVNAHTNFEETVYKLEIPADNPEYFETAMLIFKDWASAITFDPEELEKERGVVLEEWRGRLGLSGRLADTVIPFELKDSAYVDRLAIGLPEVIQNVSREEVVNFYKKWYRPENMAIAIAGVVDPKVAEWIIKNIMGEIPASTDRVIPPKGKVPVRTEKDMLIFTDPEFTFTQIQIVSQKENFGPTLTEGDIREGFLSNLVDTIVNARLSQITVDPDSPWLAAAAVDYTETYGASFEGYYLVPKEGMFAQALMTMFDEIDRVLLHGFTQSEIEWAVNSMLNEYTQWYEQSESTDSVTRVNALTNYFLFGSIPVSDDDYIEIARRLLNSITLDELNAKATSIFAGRGTIAMIYAPSSAAEELPSKEEFINFWENYQSEEIAAYEDVSISDELMARPAKQADIVSTQEMKNLKAKEYILSNGARIIIRKNEADKSLIMMNAISLGGASLVSDKEYASAVMSPMYAIYSGIGGMDFVSLQKYLSTKYVGINVMVNDQNECIVGQASPDTFEYLLQLTNQLMTNPQFTDQGWNFVSLQSQQQAKSYNVQPSDVLVSRVREILYGKSIRHTAINDEFVSQLNQADSERIFKQRFSNAADFTFIFSGDLDEDAVIDLCRYYIGTIPGETGKTESPVYENIKFPKGITKETVNKGQDDKGLVYICFGGKLPAAKNLDEQYYDSEMLEQFRALADIKLREIIREDKSGTYGVSVYAGIQGDKERYFDFQVSFGCEPAREKELEAEVIATLKKLATELPSEADVEKLKESYRRSFEVNQMNGSWWLEMLANIEVYKDTPAQAAYDDTFAIKNITAKALQEQAKKYIDTTNYVSVFLEPEK